MNLPTTTTMNLRLRFDKVAAKDLDKLSAMDLAACVYSEIDGSYPVPPVEQRSPISDRSEVIRAGHISGEGDWLVKGGTLLPSSSMYRGGVTVSGYR
jgi:hypothetical protein